MSPALPRSNSINVIGPCGKTYCFRKEYAGIQVQCPTCRKIYQVPDSESEDFSPLHNYVMKKSGLKAQVEDEGPAESWRKTFEVRQEFWSLSEIYVISEVGNDDVLCVADRPRRFFNVLIYFLLTFLLFGAILIGPLADQPFLSLVLGLILASLLALRFKFSKRHVTFYADEGRSRALFFVCDMKQMEFPRAHFQIEDSNGEILGSLVKPWIGDVFRSPWMVRDSKGQLIMTVKEESVMLSLLRRLFVSKLWWFRTNFILVDPKTDDICGEFNREWEIADKYLLDLTDNSVEIDIRLLWALSVLLDSAERR